MAKVVYCAQCGQKIPIIRKALPNIGRIIDIIKPHECTEEIQELDLTPMDVPRFEGEGEKEDEKFVQNLNDLRPPSMPNSPDFRDRRKEEDVKSSAPPSVLDSLQSMQASVPDKELIDPE